MDTVTKAAYITSSAMLGAAVIGGVFTYFNRRKKDNRKGVRIVRLNTHHLWFSLDDLELEVKNSFRVPRSVHDWEVKQEIYRDIMLNKIRVWRKILIALLDKIHCQGEGNCDSCHNKISMEQSRKLHMKMVSEGVDKYTGYYKNNSNYTKSEKKALDIAMPKFNVIHDAKVTDVTRAIDRAHQITEYFPDWCPVKSAASIYNAYEAAFTNMKIDIVHAVKTLNGDLKGYTFNRKN